MITRLSLLTLEGVGNTNFTERTFNDREGAKFFRMILSTDYSE